MNLTIDAGPVTVLISCECGWRTVHSSRAHAWYAGARHLKHWHGDLHAGARARNTARHAAARELPRVIGPGYPNQTPEEA